jgi:hypothetical protein
LLKTAVVTQVTASKLVVDDPLDSVITAFKLLSHRLKLDAQAVANLVAVVAINQDMRPILFTNLVVAKRQVSRFAFKPAKAAVDRRVRNVSMTLLHLAS